jgi:Icc-related predicted phosphoesterase
MKILSLSDIVVNMIYSPQIRTRFADVDLVLGCGDLSYDYMEYVVSMLDVPTFFVRGNHSYALEYGDGLPKSQPHGVIDLHRQVVNHRGLLLAGVEGSLRYRRGPYQYTQEDMWLNVWTMTPALLYNKVRYGRYLDILVTHAPPWKIHDRLDLPHQGIKAFRWLIKTFRPAYHFHGHVHVYRPDEATETLWGKTRVINTYGYRVTEVQPVIGK